MRCSSFFQPPSAIRSFSGAVLSLLLTFPAVVVAHSGHGDHFQGGSKASQTQKKAIKVEAGAAKRLGIKVEPVSRRQMAAGIKTTGQIEPLPNQKVEVTTPVAGSLVKLLAAPGAFVSAGQVVAVLSSAELAELRVESVEKQAEATGDVQEAQADLQLAQQNYERERRLAAADLQQTRSQLALAQERYTQDQRLAAAGALPRRQAQESRTQLAEAKAAETRIASRGDVLESGAQLKRARSALAVAQSRLRLSSAGY